MTAEGEVVDWKMNACVMYNVQTMVNNLYSEEMHPAETIQATSGFQCDLVVHCEDRFLVCLESGEVYCYCRH